MLRKSLRVWPGRPPGPGDCVCPCILSFFRRRRTARSMHILSRVRCRFVARVSAGRVNCGAVLPLCAAPSRSVIAPHALVISARAVGHGHSGHTSGEANRLCQKPTAPTVAGQSSMASGANEAARDTASDTRTSLSDTAHRTFAVAQDDAGGVVGEGTVHHARPTNAVALSMQHLAPGRDEDAATSQAQRTECLGRCRELKLLVDREMRAEVARDSAEGFAALPPLTPAGWAVEHRPGTNFFFMRKVFDADAMRDMPRYCSVEEELRRRRGGGRVVVPPASPRVGSHERWVVQKGGRYVKRPSAVEQYGDLASAERGGCHNVPRSNKDVIVFAPFRVQDLSLYDYNVAVCEWACFDLLVRKQPPTTSDASTPCREDARLLLQGQRRVWDEQQCLFVRLASVNSELRLRFVQLLSRSQARALERYAALGRGEPYYLELLRRLRVAADAGRKSAKGSAQPCTVRRMRHPSHVAWLDEGKDTLLDDAEGEQASAAVLTTAFDASGEVARSFCYAGPYLTELSKELQDALLSYVMTDLGITAEVAEYVCQMQYFLEQEEYMGWLAHCSHFADVLSIAAGVDVAADEAARLSVK